MAETPNGPLIVLEPEGIEIPPGIVNLERFREWSRSKEFPESGRIDWIAGRLEVDMSPEDLGTHGTPKSAIATRLGLEIQEAEKGFVFIDRARFSCRNADLSVEPDVLVLLLETLESGKVHLVPSAGNLPDRYIEIEGPVDLVVECVSKSSVKKDKQRLKEAYYRAGVGEYWLADVRGPTVEFEVFMPRAGGFEPAPKDPDGFAASPLLGQRVRLARKRQAAGLIFFYSLEVR
jgi:Uma2 family endonuclease